MFHFDVSGVCVLSILLLEELPMLPASHLRLLRGDWKRTQIGGDLRVSAR